MFTSLDVWVWVTIIYFYFAIRVNWSKIFGASKGGVGCIFLPLVTYFKRSTATNALDLIDCIGFRYALLEALKMNQLYVNVL